MTTEPHPLSLVLDLGNSYFRIGYSGDDTPRIDTESHYGVNTKSPQLEEIGGSLPLGNPNSQTSNERYLFSDKMHEYRPGFNYHPLLRPDSSVPESFFPAFFQSEVLARLNLESKSMPVLLAENNLLPKSERVSFLQMFLEGGLTPSFFMLRKSVLSLYACGKTSGAVVDSGSYWTSVSPIEEGYFCPEAHWRVPFGGEQVTERIAKEFKGDFTNILPESVSGEGNDLNFLEESFFDFERLVFARHIKSTLLGEEGRLI